MSEATFRAKVPALMRRLLSETAFGFGLDDVAAIYGNSGGETDGFRLMQEEKPLVKGSRGGWSLFQWTGSRRVAFETYCKQKGLALDSFEAANEFLIYELKTTEKRSVTMVKQAAGLDAKTSAFFRAFERGDANLSHMDRRINWAKIAKDAYGSAQAMPKVTPAAPKDTPAPVAAPATPAAPSRDRTPLWVKGLSWLAGAALRALTSRDPAPTPAPLPTAPVTAPASPVVVPAAPAGVVYPDWYNEALKDLGFHETGNNRGIEKLIKDAKCGSLGDPYCAIGCNAWLERAGVKGTRSAMARSFERSVEFVKLSGPAPGAITTMWRGSPSAGTGHVFLYTGHTKSGKLLGLGANQSDGVNISAEDSARVVGYFWPRSRLLPKVGKVLVADNGTPINTKET